MPRRFKITFRQNYWTIWRRSSLGGWIWPIAIGKDLSALCREIEDHPLYGIKAYRP